MAGSSADTSRYIFVESKRYYGQRYQTNALWLDWDVNETNDELVWFQIASMAAASGPGGRVEFSAGKSFQPAQLGTPGADVLFTDGSAIVAGRLVTVDTGGTFQYTDESTNYIVVGSVSTFTQVVLGSSYKFTDDEKAFTSSYDLVGCRVKFTSGAQSGNTFTISTHLGQQITISGNAAGVVAGDEYTILPPSIVVGTASDQIYLVTWWEDISEVEDALISTGTAADILDPISGETPSHRRQLRWCLHLNWSGTQSGSVLNGHAAVSIATLDLGSDDTIVTADITDGPYIYSMDKSYDQGLEVDTLISQTLDTRITTLEGTVPALDVFGSLDYRVMPFSDWKWSNSGDENLGYSDTVFHTNSLANYTTDPYTGTVTAGSIANTAVESSFLYIDTSAALDALEGSLADNALTQQETSTGNDILTRDLAVLAVHADNASPAVVERLFPMGDIPRKQGLNWVLFDDGATHHPVKVSPGQIYMYGTLYQNPGQTLLADADDTAGHVSGTVPTSSWAYLYALEASSSRRDLVFLFDTAKPMWNGYHPTLVGMCIGITYFDVSGVPARATCVGNRVEFDYKDTIEATSTGGFASEAFVIQPPTGITTFEIRVFGTVSAAGRVRYEINTEAQLSNLSELRVTGRLHAETNFDIFHVIQGTSGTYRVDTYDVDGVIGDYFFHYHALTFDPTYMPDQEVWED